MKRKEVFLLLMAVITISVLGSCLSNKGAPKTSLDWAGVYTGTTPAADAEGINVRLKIDKDNTYELAYDYIGKPANTSSTNTGSFTWNDTGDIINLGLAETPSYYKVAENKLIQLDMAGKPITGQFADMYVLTKSK